MTTNGWQVSVPEARRVRVLNKHVYIQIRFQAGKLVANEIAKPQVSINVNNSSTTALVCTFTSISNCKNRN